MLADFFRKSLVIEGRGISKYELIDFLKGFSITTIVLMHFFQFDYLPGIIYKALSIGGTGVHIFFFCSGFGLFMSFSKKRVSFIEFIQKRFTKIYIPYILIVIISSFLPYMLETKKLPTVLSHIFLYKMFSPLYEDTLGPFWFISTLFQFYFLFILIIKIKEYLGTKKFLLYCAILSVFWWIFSAMTGISQERIWGSFFLQYLWEFALGICFAEGLIQKKNYSISRLSLLGIAIIGISIAGIAKIIDGPLVVFNDVFAFCGYGAVAVGLYSLMCPIINKVILFINSISYELYLVHFLLYQSIHMLVENDVLCGLLAIPLSIIISIYYSKFSKVLIKKVNYLIGVK